jgi:deoxyribodipyrimidine photolyase-related protein
MSDYKKGNWSEIWDSLFCNFIDKNRVFFNKNPRMRLLVISFDKMNHDKKDKLLSVANKYLYKLDISNNL